MEKAIIYNRTSTIDQNPGLQVQECRDFCKLKGWEVVDELEEQESAFKEDSKRKVFQSMIERGKKGEFNHIVVWNMDRFSRQPEAHVLNQVKILSTIHNIQVHAVHGDVWSEVVESVGGLKGMGFIGEALSEFLEKLLRGLEFQRANRESQVKSERVKLAVRKEEGKMTKSYKGNKWGRKELSAQTIKKVLELSEQGLSMRDISHEVKYYDKNNNEKYISKSAVHKIISGKHRKNMLVKVEDLN